MYQLYESREHFFLMNMSGPTYLMLHARIVPFLSSASAEKNWIDPYVPDQYTATVLTPFPGLSYFL